MTDITTVEEVDAGEYTVRVAQTEDGAAWEAVVIGEGGSTSGSAPGGMAGLFTIGYTPSSDDSEPGPLGPPVTAPHRWVAVGFAIEAYEWGEVGEEPVDVQSGYDTAEIDGLSITGGRDNAYDVVFEDLDTDADGGNDD